MFTWSLLNSLGQLFVECFEFTNDFIPSFNFFFEVRLLIDETLVLNFEVLGSTKSYSNFVELINKLGVIVLKSPSFSNIEIKIVSSQVFRDNPLLNFWFNLCGSPRLTGHNFNIKIIAKLIVESNW